MTVNLRPASLIIFAIVLGTCAAAAQTVGPVEAVGPNGAVTQKLALTPVQRSAIYSAVVQQRVRTSNGAISATIGALVPPVGRVA